MNMLNASEPNSSQSGAILDKDSRIEWLEDRVSELEAEVIRQNKLLDRYRASLLAMKNTISLVSSSSSESE